MCAANPSAFRVRSAVCVIGLSASVALIVGEVRADTITPITQQRSVHAMVIVPPCDPRTDFDDKSAIDFGPFNGNVEASRICDFAQGIAVATQQSQIDPASMTAVGESACDVVSVNPTVIHAIPSSVFIVNFQTSQPVRYFFDGDLAASGALPVVLSFARLRLEDAANQAIVNLQVEPQSGGAMNTLAVHESGSLPAGQYEINIQAVAAVDAMVPPHGTGESTFDISALFQRPGDANIDGTVNVDDVLAVIGAWGACPAAPAFCPIDMDGDGSVDIDDLLLVIGNWG
jgi:hypothetical protein